MIPAVFKILANFLVFTFLFNFNAIFKIEK